MTAPLPPTCVRTLWMAPWSKFRYVDWEENNKCVTLKYRSSAKKIPQKIFCERIVFIIIYFFLNIGNIYTKGVGIYY